MIEVTVLKWLKKEGDFITEGDVILEVATDKVDAEVPAMCSETIKQLLVQKGDVVDIGSPLATIITADKGFSEKQYESERITTSIESSSSRQHIIPAVQITQKSIVNNDLPRLYSPLVRNIAQKENISSQDLANIPSTAKDNRVTKRDILKYIEKRTQLSIKDSPANKLEDLVCSPGDEVIQMDRVRKLIAARMVASKHIAPHVTSFISADVTKLVEWRANNKIISKDGTTISLTYISIFIEAIAKTLKSFPLVNASVVGDNIIKKKAINIGLAVALPDGNLMRDVNHLAIFAPMMGLATFFMFYPTLQKTEGACESVGMRYGWLLGIFVLLFMAGAIVCSISGYATVPTVIFLVHIVVSYTVLPFFVVLLMTFVALITTHLLFPYQSLSLIAAAWGSWGYFFLVVVFFGVIMKVISTNKANEVLLFNKVTHLSTLAAYKSREVLETDHYLYHLDRLTQNDTYEEDMLPPIVKTLGTLVENKGISKEAQAIVQDTVDRLEGCREFIEERMYIERHHLTLKIAKVNITDMVRRIVTDFDKLGLQWQLMLHNVTQQEDFICDPGKIARLLTDSMQFIDNNKKINGEGIVSMYITDTEINYILNASGRNYKKLPAIAFVITTSSTKPVIKSIYEELLDVIVPIFVATMDDLYTQGVIRIVDAHYGCFFVDTTDQEISFSYILPVQLNEIRDVVMDAHLSLDYNIVDTTASIMQEKALEETLLQKTSLTRAVISATIQLMKKCHGEQKRYSGAPFYTHSMAVTELLLMETKDPDAIVAALLHDVIKKSQVPLSYIKARFGRDVAYILDKITNISSTFRKKSLLNRKMKYYYYATVRRRTSVQYK